MEEQGVRIDGRSSAQMREVLIVPGVSPYAEGSAEVSFGETKVLVAASVEREVPRWLEQEGGGWITAEYGMLPRSTHTRCKREATAGKQGGRTLEIQRLIGRSLRAAMNLSALDGITIRLDCDVLVADGGTRTAAISGGWVALYQAVQWCKRNELLAEEVTVSPIAAVSVGMVQGRALLNLCYTEDSNADFDLNLVFDGSMDLIEIQGTAERQSLSEGGLLDLIALGNEGAQAIVAEQCRVLGVVDK